MDGLLQDAHISKNQLVSEIRHEFGGNNINEQHNSCCTDHPKVSVDIERVLDAIDNLCRAVDSNLVRNAVEMENGLIDKCEELKRQKLLMLKLCNMEGGVTH